MTPRYTPRIPLRGIQLALVLLATRAAFAQHQVQLPSGEFVRGSQIRRDEAGHYVLTTPRGDLTFPPGTPVVVAEPAAYTQARQLMNQGRHDAAIRLLKETIEAYENLQWDAQARVRLADAHHAAGNFKEAAETYDQVAGESPRALEELDRLARYCEALQKTDRIADLMNLIRQIIRHATRPAAARAQMLRGNLHFDRGEFENAALDFLRIVELFQDVPDLQPQALSKTVDSLRMLDHPEVGDYAKRLERKQ